MSREIKFRAWHKAEKKMCKVSTLNAKGAFLIGVKKGRNSIDERSIIYAPENGRFCKNKEIVLMQFTGLRDKDGKMIFEGDMFNRYNVVEFYAGSYCINGDTPLAYMTRHAIIGNRYEHPELLKQKKWSNEK